MYLSSDNDAISQKLYENNNMTTVLLSKIFDDCVGDANAGKCFRDALKPYRGEAERSVVGYMVIYQIILKCVIITNGYILRFGFFGTK